MTRIRQSAEKRLAGSPEKRFLRGPICDELVIEHVAYQFGVPPACSAAQGHWRVSLRFTGQQRRPYDSPPFSIPLWLGTFDTYWPFRLVGDVCGPGPSAHDFYATDQTWSDFADVWPIEIGFGGTNGTHPGELIILFPDSFGLTPPSEWVPGDCVTIRAEPPPGISEDLWIEDIQWGAELPPCTDEDAHSHQWWRYQFRYTVPREPGATRELLTGADQRLAYDWFFSPCAQPNPDIEVYTGKTHWIDPPFGGPSMQMQFPTASGDLQEVVIWLPDDAGIYPLTGWDLWDYRSSSPVQFHLFEFAYIETDPFVFEPGCPEGEHLNQVFTPIGPHNLAGQEYWLLGNTTRTLYAMNPAPGCGVFSAPKVSSWHLGYCNGILNPPNGFANLLFPIEVDPLPPYPFELGETVTIIGDLNWDRARW